MNRRKIKQPLYDLMESFLDLPSTHIKDEGFKTHIIDTMKVRYSQVEPQTYGWQLWTTISITVWKGCDLATVIETMLHELTHLVIAVVLMIADKVEVHGSEFWELHSVLAMEAFPQLGEIHLTTYDQLSQLLRERIPWISQAY